MERRRPEPTLPNVATPHPARHLLTRPDTGLVPTRSHTPSSPACKHNAFFIYPKSIIPMLRIRRQMFFGPPGSGSSLASSDPARYGTYPDQIPHTLLAQHFISEIHQSNCMVPVEAYFELICLSASVCESLCFRTSWIRIRLSKVRVGSGSFYQANVRKTFIPTVCTVWCSVTSLRLFILEKWFKCS